MRRVFAFEITQKQQYLFNIIRSITKLQKAIEYSSMNVSLTYSRGLEVPIFD